MDICHVHGCLLESRCPTCGWRQATLPRAVRIHVCSYCGHDLHSSPVDPVNGPATDPVNGPATERMLWYAREGARLVHAGEVIALTGRNESQSLKLAYGRLAELAGRRDLPAVERFFADGNPPTRRFEARDPDERSVAPSGECS